MFRSTKKKAQKVIRNTVEKDEDSDTTEDQTDAPVVIRRKKKKPKVSGMIIRSFPLQEDEEDEPPRLKKRRRKKGLGFGGALDAEAQEDFTSKEETGLEIRSYGKESLENLKAQQKTKPTTEKTAEAETNSEIEKSSETPAPKIHHEVESSLAQGADNTVGETIVLTGEEAMNMQMQQPTEVMGDIFLTKVHGIMVQELDDAVESSAWEAQIARRAGLQPSNEPSQPPTSKLPSLNSLRHQLESTFENVQLQQQDLEHSIMRRKADLAQTESELKRQQQSLHDAGKACTDYQILRHALAMWVGALRDMQQKVEPIQETLIEIILSQYKTAQKEWINWQDDAISILQDAAKIDQILGRQPQLPTSNETATGTDEFGRDIQSQYLREREKRVNNRIERQKLQSDRSVIDGSDAILCIWINNEDREKRYRILQEALRVALSDLDEEYTDISKLLAVFAQWRETNSDEYRQCYASMSLGDLTSVLVQVQFCRSSWLLSMLQTNAPSDNESHLFSWLPSLVAVDKECKADEESPTQRIFKRIFVPFLLALLTEAPAMCFLSAEKSQLLRNLVAETIKNLDNKSPEFAELETALVNAITDLLGKVSIPLVKGGIRGDIEEIDQVMNHAAEFATTGQGKCIQQLLLNLLNDWVPVVKRSSEYETLGQCVLGFISSRYLFFLSSISSGVAAEMFSPIWKILERENKDWLESPSLFLQGAPVRAAAAAYGFS